MSTFEPGTLIPRGIYRRMLDRCIEDPTCLDGNAEFYAACADKERELRLALRNPKNWLSQYFSKTPDKDEVHGLMTELLFHLNHYDLDTSELDDWIQCHLHDKEV